MPALRLALVLVAALAGCAVHDAKPSFRAGVLIDDRGIVVPLPPPSFYEAPVQPVDVHGIVVGDDPILAGTQLRIEDNDGGAAADLSLADDQRQFTASGLVIDLRANCLELWAESPEGSAGDPALYSVRIVDAGSIEVVEGCG